MARPYPLRVLRDPCGQGFWVFWLIASCQLLAAMFSKTVHSTTFPLWSEFPTLSFCSPFCQAKTTTWPEKNRDPHGVEQTFRSAVRRNKNPFLAPQVRGPGARFMWRGGGPGSRRPRFSRDGMGDALRGRVEIRAWRSGSALGGRTAL
jgi:hypothetical protein